MTHCQLARYRIDLAPYSTTIEDRDLEIWTKQPGNEVFRKAVDEWREECKLIAERIRKNVDQQFAVISQWHSRNKFQTTFMFSMILAIYEVCYRRLYYWWVVCRIFVLLEALFNLCLVTYQQWCLWRLWNAVCSDTNKHMVQPSQLNVSTLLEFIC